MVRLFRTLIVNRELLASLVAKEFKVRYKQSMIGPAWAFVQPLVFMGLFVMIGAFLKVKTALPYPVFIYSGLLPWAFFANSLNFATGSLVANGQIIRKIYCPKVLFPVAAVVTCLVDFAIASVMMAVLFILYRLPLSPTHLLLPLLLALQLFFTVGLSLVTSSVAVYKRDVMVGMPILIQFWMFVSPVMYPLTSVPERWRSLYLLNPMAGLIECYRNAISGASVDGGIILYVFLVSMLLLWVGMRLFGLLEKRMSDAV